MQFYFMDMLKFINYDIHQISPFFAIINDPIINIYT